MVEDRSSPLIVDLPMLPGPDSILVSPVIIIARQLPPCHPSTTHIILGERMVPTHIRIRSFLFTLALLLTSIITRLLYRRLFPLELASHKAFHRPLDITSLQIPLATAEP